MDHCDLLSRCLPHDRAARLSDRAHRAVLSSVLGVYKPIITPIGMSGWGPFTWLFTFPSPLCLSLAVGTVRRGDRGGSTDDDGDGGDDVHTGKGAGFSALEGLGGRLGGRFLCLTDDS